MCQAFGTFISASLAVEKNEKRKKLHPEEEWIQWYPLEIRNFPHWTVVDDIKATITTVGPTSQRVRIMHYDPVPTLSVARAYFREEPDRDDCLKALAGYEFSPGYSLQVMALPRTASLLSSNSSVPASLISSWCCVFFFTQAPLYELWVDRVEGYLLGLQELENYKACV